MQESSIFFLGIAVSVIIVIIAWYVLSGNRKKRRKDKNGGATLIQRQLKEKRAHLREVLNYFRSQPHVRNDDIENLLGVSDSTATRYLDALEKMEKIKQVGKVGRNVYYVPIDLSPMPFESEHDWSR